MFDLSVIKNESPQLFVSEKGNLFVGDLDTSGSIVHGLRCYYINIDNPSEFDYLILYNDTFGHVCSRHLRYETTYNHEY